MKTFLAVAIALLWAVAPTYAEIPAESIYKAEPASPQQERKAVIYKEAIDGDTFRSSRALINLWGIEASEDTVYASVAKMYLEVVLADGALSCKLMELQDMTYHCLIDGRDVGSMIVQMGMAKATDEYYEQEQEIAQKEGRGVWKNLQQ